jgi:hypothetical protein
VDDAVSTSQGRNATSLAATATGGGVSGTVGPRVYDRERSLRHHVVALVLVVVALEKPKSGSEYTQNVSDVVAIVGAQT